MEGTFHRKPFCFPKTVFPVLDKQKRRNLDRRQLQSIDFEHRSELTKPIDYTKARCSSAMDGSTSKLQIEINQGSH